FFSQTRVLNAVALYEVIQICDWGWSVWPVCSAARGSKTFVSLSLSFQLPQLIKAWRGYRDVISSARP
ncbi:MAG: hypothetical protein J0M26_29065, partial [Planctomycetes bacterium]|nr:hypothetical protein [Planctomycetota bacterium]